MNQDQIDRLLNEGIAAAKKGEKERAKELLLSIIEVDEGNNKAWLWLSGVVDSDEDRQICLENVLTIDPKNSTARKGLEQLAGGGAVPSISYQSESIYDDIWVRDDDICEYCAAEIELEDKRCPNCRRTINTSYYRYPKPSSDLTIYWVLLLGIAQLSLIIIMLNLLLRESLVSTVWQAIMLIVLVILVAGVFLRQFWAYVASLVFLIFSIATIIIGLIIGPTVEDVVAQSLQTGFFQTLANRPYIYVLGPLEDLVEPLQSLAIILALLYGVFRVGPDFERVKVRQVARVDRDLSDASQFFTAGSRYSQQEKWAQAILQFQRAVALAPTQFYYHRELGKAYAHLGYYQRSLDVLESAYHMTTNVELKSELEQIIAQVKRESIQSSQLVTIRK